jgi:hypothetical protein
MGALLARSATSPAPGPHFFHHTCFVERLKCCATACRSADVYVGVPRSERVPWGGRACVCLRGRCSSGRQPRRTEGTSSAAGGLTAKFAPP